MTTGRRQEESWDDWVSPKEILRLFVRHPFVLLISMFAGVLLAFVWVGSQTPQYRAQATILLEEAPLQGGTLGKLSELATKTSSATEMAMLRSRTLAQQAVLGASDGRILTPNHDEYSRRLGLTTHVQDEGLTPLAMAVKRLRGERVGEGRLFAEVDATMPPPAQGLLVEFLSPERVLLSTPVGSGGLPKTGANPIEFAYVPGLAVEYQGARMRFEALGDLRGRIFRISWAPGDSVVSGILSRTQVLEETKDSGVLQLTFDDSDPYRAADVANALASNFVDMNAERVKVAASERVSEIAEQLAAELRNLNAAQDEFVRLQKENPESISFEAVTNSLIEQQGEFNVQANELGNRMALLTIIVEQLKDENFTAFSQIGTEIDDPVTRAFISQLTTLQVELERLGGMNRDAYRSLLQERILTAQDAVVNLEGDLQALRELVRVLRANDWSAMAGISSENNSSAIVAVDPLTNLLLARIAELSIEYNENFEELTLLHPDMEKLVGQLESNRKEVLSHLESRIQFSEQVVKYQTQIVNTHETTLSEHDDDLEGRTLEAIGTFQRLTARNLESRLTGMHAEEKIIQAKIAEITAELGTIPDQQRALDVPKRKMKNHQEMVSWLMRAKSEAEISRAGSGGTALLIDTALPPMQRFKPRMTFSLLLGLVLGLGAGVLLALGLERMQGRLLNEIGLARAAGLPVLATLYDSRSRFFESRKAAKAFLTLRDDPNGEAAESFRSLRARITVARDACGSMRTIGVTSCAPDPSKSSTNANIALSFATGGEKVMLIDADMRSPRAHDLFGVELEGGLAEILSGELDWRRCQRTTSHRRMRLITAGELGGIPAGDLLSSPRFDKLLEELLAFYDTVVIDLPHTLMFADVETLGHKLDALMLLYRRDSLPGRTLGDVARRLQDSGANLLGCILGGLRTKHRRWPRPPRIRKRSVRSGRKSAA